MMEIIANGKSDYKIVYSASESIARYTAAKELSDNIFAVSGARLEIVKDAECNLKLGEKCFSIGKTYLLKDAGIEFDYSTLNGDGFFIKNIKDTIIIDGDNKRGTLYGVYEFLERFLGVRFVSSETTYYPKTDKLSIDNLDIVEVPDFRFRHFLAGDIWLGNEDPYMQQLACRMRMSHEQQCAPEEYGGGCTWFNKLKLERTHNTLQYVLPSEYLDKNPEMFWMYNGKASELCLSNGITEDGEIDESMEYSCAKAVLKTVKQFALEDREALFFMIGQMDFPAKPCECEKCKKNIEKYGTRSGVSIVFFNAVVRAANKWADEINLGHKINIITFAYNYTQEPPVKLDEKTGKFVPYNELVKTDDHLFIRIAPFIYNYAIAVGDERQERRLQEIYEKWDTMTQNLMVWDYMMNTDENFWYIPYLHLMQPNYQYYLKHNVKYAMTQCNFTDTNCFQSKIMLYLASKLMWNVNADAEKIIDEYMTLEYGIMKDDVLKYMDFMDKMYEHAGKEYPDLKITPAQRNNAYYQDPVTYEKEYMFGGLQIVRDAIAKLEGIQMEQDEKQKLMKKLNRVLLKPLRMLMRNTIMYHEIYGQKPQEVRDIIEEYFAVCDKVGVIQHSTGVTVTDEKIIFGVK